MAVDADSTLFFSKSGLQNKLLRQLRQGTIPIEDRVDLHGHTTHEAEEQLVQFFSHCEISGARCILLIHGKGRTGEAVLKSWVNHWLREQPNVLAFATAKPKHGGTGAMYVLLKRARPL